MEPLKYFKCYFNWRYYSVKNYFLASLKYYKRNWHYLLKKLWILQALKEELLIFTKVVNKRRNRSYNQNKSWCRWNFGVAKYIHRFKYFQFIWEVYYFKYKWNRALFNGKMISHLSPSLWAAAPNGDPRTTNAVESFHCHLNSLFNSVSRIYIE